MENFKIIDDIDEGAFGIVQKARSLKTGETVAIKRMKKRYTSWEECMNLREIRSLRKLKHPNIIKLKEVFKLENELYMVFDYADRNLLRMYSEDFKSKNRQMPEETVKSIMQQIVKGLAHMHKNGYFHRDMKPENILISKEGKVKLADFGLAREIRSSPPYTDYVSTRWYRAPEILLKSPNYNSPVDIFALGCIMAELFIGKPLFDGNSEIDQLQKICKVLGTPSKHWSEGYKLAGQLGFNFPKCDSIALKTLIPKASDEAIDLLQQMLRFDSGKRISASKILSHSFLKGISVDVSGEESHIKPLVSTKYREDRKENNDSFFNEFNDLLNNNTTKGQKKKTISKNNNFAKNQKIMGINNEEKRKMAENYRYTVQPNLDDFEENLKILEQQINVKVGNTNVTPNSKFSQAVKNQLFGNSSKQKDLYSSGRKNLKSLKSNSQTVIDQILTPNKHYDFDDYIKRLSDKSNKSNRFRSEKDKKTETGKNQFSIFSKEQREMNAKTFDKDKQVRRGTRDFNFDYDDKIEKLLNISGFKNKKDDKPDKGGLLSKAMFNDIRTSKPKSEMQPSYLNGITILQKFN